MEQPLHSPPVTGGIARLLPDVLRVVAPNAGPLTGAGTNTWLLGREQVLVLDPGPADAAHLAAIEAAAPGPIALIVVTHTHSDHSPGAAPLAARTGAPLIGVPGPVDAEYDDSFRPDRVPADGERLRVPGVTLRAVYTPGHVGNHVCWFHEEERLLFTGDHILGGVTTVILPPSGDMGDFLASLAKLRALEARALAPGHGPVLDQPAAVIDALVRHRLAREDKTLRAVRRLGAASIAELLPVVYDDVPVAMHRVARHSLWAHLLKLARDGRVREDGGRWCVA
jgi:glyoxylase-like metal-dependent hydrolase (beta-lactamase superfamily II)